MNLHLVIFLTLLSMSAQAATWSCRNNDLEITCNDGKCEAAGCDCDDGNGFTPMQVSVADSGAMSICAYSGCWEGSGNVTITDDFFVILGEDLVFSTAPDSEGSGQSIALAIDRNDSIGILKAGSFAHPVTCEVSRETE